MTDQEKTSQPEATQAEPDEELWRSNQVQFDFHIMETQPVGRGVQSVLAVNGYAIHLEGQLGLEALERFEEFIDMARRQLSNRGIERSDIRFVLKSAAP